MGIAHVGMFTGALVGGAEVLTSSMGLLGIITGKEKRDSDWQYRFQMMGLASGTLSVFHFSYLHTGRYQSAKTFALLALIPSVFQLGAGIYCKANNEDGISGKETALVAVQTGLLVFGLNQAICSLPALALRAKGGDDQALNRLYMRWYDKKDAKAAQEISRLAVDNPYRFAANHSTVLFSEAVDDVSARLVLSDLLSVQDGISLPSASGMVLQAILDRPYLFQKSDIKKLLVHLRALQGREINGKGSLGIETLTMHRHGLAEEIIKEAPKVFKGDDWLFFADSLQSVWYKIRPGQRLEIALSWEGALRLGYENGMRPTRDLFRTLEKSQYEKFVENCLQEAVAAGRAHVQPVGLNRLATAVMEDVMIASSHSSGTTHLMERVGAMIMQRRDADIAAFGFLGDFCCWEGTPLRKQVLAYLSRIGSDPQWEGSGGEAMLSLVVHGERRTFGQPGLFNGWFLNHDWQRRYFGYVEELMGDREYLNSPVLGAIARLHGWRLDQVAETVVKLG